MTIKPATDRYIFDKLPVGFRFPEHYLLLITAAAVLPDLNPWWFLAESRELADFWYRTLKVQYPDRSLVPIAKRDDWSDTLACFDGGDQSGDPKLHHIHAYTEPGWEQRGTWASFGEWLRQAEFDSAEYKASDAAD